MEYTNAPPGENRQDSALGLQVEEIRRKVEEIYDQRSLSFRVVSVAGWRKPSFAPPSDAAFIRLPSEMDAHVRGVFWNRGASKDYLYYRISADNEELPKHRPCPPHYTTPEFVVFHSQPTRNRYSDIPDREDVYDFLRQRIHQFVCVGKKQVSVLEKDANTLKTIVRLSQWEQSDYGKYRESRLRVAYPRDSNRAIEKRYKESALRGIGLRWPRKPSHRLREWPGVLQDLGIVVRLLSR